jgi:tetratricopeptide (TPR) repeat protein
LRFAGGCGILDATERRNTVMKLAAALCSLALMTPVAFAAGTGVPEATNPNKDCKAGEVFDTKTKTCTAAQSGSLSDPDRIDAARHFAFAGDVDAATRALDGLADANTAEALTLLGFVTRMSGDFAGALAYYQAALELDPNHWQARSYMGQGYVEAGDSAAARAQLTLIRTTGGRGTWAEISLRQAIERGAGYRY